MTNEDLYERAKQAIQDLFGDTSVSRSEARQNLEGLKGEINIMLSTLEGD